uniref:Uncharacterized protein n=1 Tax=Vitis vinifera TaxID=29760 RepID=F6I1R8_VITVI
MKGISLGQKPKVSSPLLGMV